MARKTAQAEDPGDEKDKKVVVHVKPLEMRRATFHIIGLRPYVQNRFSEKAEKEMSDKDEKPKPRPGERKPPKPPKDFKKMGLDAMHVSTENWPGIPVQAFVNAMNSACRLTNLKMTIEKLAVEVEGDGDDAKEPIQLVKIVGKWRLFKDHVRNRTTGNCAIQCRPIWDKWSAIVRVQYDADQFNLTDVTNLMIRAGRQVGIGEGRPDSKNSCGRGWGKFKIQSA